MVSGIYSAPETRWVIISIFNVTSIKTQRICLWIPLVGISYRIPLHVHVLSLYISSVHSNNIWNYIYYTSFHPPTFAGLNNKFLYFGITSIKLLILVLLVDSIVVHTNMYVLYFEVTNVQCMPLGHYYSIGQCIPIIQIKTIEIWSRYNTVRHNTILYASRQLHFMYHVFNSQ